MNPDTLTPDVNVTKIEIQNEIKSTKIKKSDNKCLTSVTIREIPKQENAEEQESNAEITDVTNVATAVLNVQKHGLNAAVTNIYRMEKGDKHVRKPVHGYPESKKPATFLRHYWVQVHLGAGIPDDSSPLSYDSSRNSFVALVFTITLIMLVITTCFVGYIYYTDDLREYFLYEGKLFLFVSMGGMLILSFTMMCSTCARMLPCNIVVLLFAVFFMSLMSAYITVRYSTDIIFFVLIITAIVVLVCLCLAMTSFDFTSFLLYIIGVSVAFGALTLMVGIVTLTTGVRYKSVHLLLLAVGTILNIITLITQLQMILGGKNVEISEDDWALASFMLYTSIIEMFLKILQLAGEIGDDD